MTKISVVVLVLVALPHTLSSAESTQTPAQTTANGSNPDLAWFNDKVPPAVTAGYAQQMATIFTSCMNVQSTTQTLADAFTKKPVAGQISMNSSCPEAPAVTDATSLTCDMVKVGDVLSQEKIKALKAKNDIAIAALSCKKNKLDAIRGELGCLTNQANTLSQQVASMDQFYTQNIQQMQKDVSVYTQIEEGLQARQKEAADRLNGNPERGEPGLLKQKADTEAALSKLVTKDIPTVRQMFDAVDTQRKTLDEQTNARATALAMDCFKSDAKYTCASDGKNAKPVSAYDFILCRYNQEWHRTKGTNKITLKGSDSLLDQRADGRTAALEGILQSIMSNAPKTATVPSNTQQFSDAADQAVGVLSAADVERLYGDKLAAFNDKGIDIRQQVMASMGSCFKRASDTVQAERKRSTSKLGMGVNGLKQLEATANDTANDMITNYARLYTDNMRGLTGMNLPINTTACNSGDPKTKLGCLDDLRKNLDGQLSGTTANSAIKTTIKGVGPVPDLPFTCSGLAGCVTALQRVHANAGDLLKQKTAAKKSYIQAANQNVLYFTKKTAAALSIKSQSLTSRVKDLNSALASLGVSNLIDIKPVQGEKLEYEEMPDGSQGLVKAPQNSLQLLGGMMNPPMLDVSADNFSGALAGLGENVQKIDADIATARTTETAIAALATTCSRDVMTAAAKSLQDSISQLNTEKCRNLGRNCGQEQGLKTLTDTISQALREGGGYLDSTTVDNLSTGVQKACRPLSSSKGQAKCTEDGSGGDSNSRQTKCLAEKCPIYGQKDIKACEAFMWASDGDTTVQTTRNNLREAMAKCNDKLVESDDKSSDSCGDIRIGCDGVFTDLQSKADVLTGAAKSTGEGTAGQGK